jgi:GntR family transcriptional regulator, transcriptional repressor for pyruvate dehydrogenase complex
LSAVAGGDSFSRNGGRRRSAGKAEEVVGVRDRSVASPRQLARVTLLESLASTLEERIIAGEFPVGARLPSEEALASDFGVSRPIVREALSKLRERGYVHTVNGSGTYVREPDAGDLAETIMRHLHLASDQITVDQLYETRSMIEVTAARLAAVRADAEDRQAIAGRLADMRRHRGDQAAYTAADVGFHVAVARASKNPFLPTLLAPLASTIIQGLFGAGEVGDAIEAGIRAHAEVLARIEQGDADGAALAMEEHLRESRRIFPTPREDPPRGHAGAAARGS